jgi:3-phosphoshikimate 1-carboxyvinyltransferase
MESLITPLESLGASVRSDRSARSLPFTILGPIKPGDVSITAKDSSQPVSALLLACAAQNGTSRIHCKGPVVSRPYIDATVAWLRATGADVQERGTTWVVRGPTKAGRDDVRVPGDASSAAYLWAAAVVSGGSVEVTGIDPKWPQADLKVLDILREMGATVRRRGDSVRVSGRLHHGTELDLTDSPDLYPLVGVLAAVTPGQVSVLRGAPHLKHKESNRLEATLRLVRAIGARARRDGGALRIVGAANPRPLRLTDLTDHRLVMSAAVAALAGRAPSRIGDARAVSKSFPGFWSTLARMQRSTART